MPVLEFVGIARAGKTTVAKLLEKDILSLRYYPERHDLIPKEYLEDNFKQSYWYAQYCIEKLNEAKKQKGIHIFERGVVDRLVIARTYKKIGVLTDTQYEDMEKLLKPHLQYVDKVFIFLIPVQESVIRAEKMGKDVKKAVPYMDNLFAEYENINKWFSNCLYLSRNSTPERLESIIQGEIKFLGF